MLRGLPFEFLLRVRLDRLAAADFWAAMKNIPVAPNVDEVPNEAIFRFRLDEAAAVAAADRLAAGGSAPSRADQPAVVTVIVRSEPSAGHAILTFDALIERGNQRFFGNKAFA